MTIHISQFMVDIIGLYASWVILKFMYLLTKLMGKKLEELEAEEEYVYKSNM